MHQGSGLHTTAHNSAAGMRGRDIRPRMWRLLRVLDSGVVTGGEPRPARGIEHEKEEEEESIAALYCTSTVPPELRFTGFKKKPGA